MVFSSLEFLLLFLPITVLVYYALLMKAGPKKSFSLSLTWLFLASLFYYAYWKPANLYIILGSLFGNYILAGAISSAVRWREPIFLLGLLLNLGSLWPYFTHEMETREAVSAHASSLRECNSCYVCDTVNP